MKFENVGNEIQREGYGSSERTYIFFPCVYLTHVVNISENQSAKELKILNCVGKRFSRDVMCLRFTII